MITFATSFGYPIRLSGIGGIPAVEMQTLLYRSLLVAEAHRREVWAGRERPFLAPDAPASLGLRADALARLAAGDAAGASALLDQANAAAAAVSGTLNGQPFDQLREISDAVGGRIEIICDGGVRRGTHVLKALASGASCASGGRLYLYALAAAGQAGVERAIGLLKDEIERGMKLMGVTSVDQLNRERLRWR